MSYSIETRSVSEFVNDAQLKLPRFQRRSTWTERQNFELAISIFQDYPVGVVIVNKETDSSWLLDGRQRRNALREMRANPVLVYGWAKKYIGIKPSDDDMEIQKKFWGKVEEYLQKDKSKDSNQDEIEDEEVSEEENSFDAERQRKGLNVLLDIIQMVHKINPSGSAWERTFDFKDFFTRVKYAPISKGKKVDPVLLREFILEMSEKLGNNLTKDSFIAYYEDNFDFLDSTKALKFEAEVDNRWKKIENSFDVIRKSERIFKEARIGVIVLMNVSPLDAQNIFSRINSGGTQLKAEELLSAKPFWNIEVNSSDSKLRIAVQEIYDRLEVEVPSNIVRWDLGASLLQRIDREHLLFDTYEESNDKNELNMDQVSLGFKLISSMYRGGMSSKHVCELEKDKKDFRKIDWDNDIDTLVEQINTFIDILLTDNFFKCFLSWKKPFAKLFGNAIVLEFLVILLKEWISEGEKSAAGSQHIIRHARILIDRLTYEYASGIWRGSGDSKMAKHIEDWKNRVVPFSAEDWARLIKGACVGVINSQDTAVKNITPILYYANVLQGIIPINEIGVTFDVDHTYPQDILDGNAMVSDKKFKDGLANLALLPKKENIAKGNKSLKDITDDWLKKNVATYLNIPVSEFETYSSVANIAKLHDKREKELLEVFSTHRTNQLAK